MKKSKTFTLILMALFVFVLIVMIVQLFPLIIDLFNRDEEISDIVTYVDSLGWRAAPALVGLSTLQVIIPLIPAAATGVVSGLCYGIFWGPLIFLGGIALGNIFVVVSVRQVGSLLTHKEQKESEHKSFLSKEKLDRISRPEIVAFFLFLIPFISGVGPYLFAETKVSLIKYVIAVVAGSIPQALIYVFLGERISSGDHVTAIITGAIIVVALVFILIFRKKILEKIMDESTEDDMLLDNIEEE